MDPKDRLLQYLLNSKVVGDSTMAKDLQMSQREVMELLEEIKKEKPGFLIINRGYGDSHVHVNYNQRQEAEINLFLNAGGFAKESEANRTKLKQAEERQQLEFENLQLQVESMRKQLFDYDETKARAKRSDIVSILGLMLALISLLTQLICNKSG